MKNSFITKKLEEFDSLWQSRTGEGFSLGIKLNGEQVWDTNRIKQFLQSTLKGQKQEYIKILNKRIKEIKQADWVVWEDSPVLTREVQLLEELKEEVKNI